MSRRRRSFRLVLNCVRALAVAALLVAVLPLVPQKARADTASCTPTDSEPCLANLAGDDTALPATPSAMTISGRGPFSSLKVTVNQTQALLNQAISITWQGGVPTDTPVADVGTAPFYRSNFLQIFQCWSPADASGPSPSNCEYGGVESIPGKFPAGVNDAAAFSRQVEHGVTPQTYNPADGYLAGDIVYSPFVAVDGTTVNKMFALYTGPIFPGQPGQVWQNPYYDYYSTNEIDLGRTFGDGTGAELFQVDTGQEAPGLGCGQKSLKQPDGSAAAPKCWLVVVPRGTPAQENAADPVLRNQPSVVATSPLSAEAWANRLTFPLNFDPADSPCAIGAVERRIVGNELATPAITSWQPTLCQSVGLPPFAYASTGDDQARRILVSGDTGAAGMAVVSNPFDPTKLDSANPVVYAPLTLSGLAIGFNVERGGHDKNGAIVDPLEGPINGTRVAHINLTPRLVAKLLTESYHGSLFLLNLKTATGYDWIKNNPYNLFEDPDFLAYNPEFRALATGQVIDSSGLLVEESTSDAANQVWQWILADPQAAAWLSGTPDMTGCPAGATADTCGMKVNPLYSTSATLNTSGVAFASPAPPNNFPKNDPYCYQTPAQPVGQVSVTPRPLCVQDTLPYSLSLESAARATRAANDGSKIAHNINDPTAQTTDTWWGSTGPQIQGSRTMFSITDTASASRYGLQVASLSRAGDDSATRTFAAPDQPGLVAGAQAMVPNAVTGVLQPSYGAGVPAGAYPLTSLTYAAVTPRSLDAGARSDYAGFVTYAAGAGQVVGLNLGQLPPGYAPLPAALAAQAKAAAALISSGDPGPAASATPAATTASLGVAGGSISTPTRSSTGSGGQTYPVSGGAVSSSPPTTAAPTPQPDGVPLQIVKTMATAVGSMRYTLPVALTVAMFAALAAFLLSRRQDVARRTLPPTDA